MRLIDAESLKVNFESNTPVAFQDMIPGIHYIIDRARTIDAVPKWIPVTERLPEAGKIVLVVGIEAINNIAVYGIKCWDVDTWRPISAPSVKWDAWMPLPKPYEVKE